MGTPQSCFSNGLQLLGWKDRGWRLQVRTHILTLDSSGKYLEWICLGHWMKASCVLRENLVALACARHDAVCKVYWEILEMALSIDPSWRSAEGFLAVRDNISDYAKARLAPAMYALHRTGITTTLLASILRL